MSPFGDLSKLRAAHEPDEAHAVAWVHNADGADLLRVWLAIQRMKGDEVTELISRFAQLGMSHAVLLANKTPKG
jgi:hypothetical protein